MASNVDDDALYLLPAYGRTYATREEVLAAWDEGKDFRMIPTSYCSSRDLQLLREEGYKRLRFITHGAVELASIEL